jgi:U3 small nucleolar RNA-associated protein 3
MDPELFRLVIEKESPELIAMLNELQESMAIVKNRLQPVLAKLRHPSKRLDKLLIAQKQGRSYLEMKLNLTLSYCTFLTFYLLMKVEGAANSVSHPVTYKLTHIKTLFEKLKPFDEKMGR